MFFSLNSAVLAITALGVTLTQAGPVLSSAPLLPRQTYDGYTLTNETVLDNGAILSVYAADEPPAAHQQQRRGVPEAEPGECVYGSDEKLKIFCDGGNAPTLRSCEELLHGLEFNPANLQPGSPPTPGGGGGSHCMSTNFGDTEERETCCVSFSHQIPYLRPIDLLEAAEPMMAKCTRESKKSGWAWNVKVVDSCVRQCLSNRPNGCDWAEKDRAGK